MAVFDFDFVFCCPCFVPDIHQAIERSTKNYEIAAHVSGNHVVKNFEVDYFKMKSLFFVCCFDYHWDSMYYDTKNRSHYHRRVYFRMCHESSCFKT